MPQKPCHGKNAPESAPGVSRSRTKTSQPRERMSLAAAVTKNAVEHLLVRGISFSYALWSFAPSMPGPITAPGDNCVLSLLQLTVDCSLNVITCD